MCALCGIATDPGRYESDLVHGREIREIPQSACSGTSFVGRHHEVAVPRGPRVVSLGVRVARDLAESGNGARIADVQNQKLGVVDRAGVKTIPRNEDVVHIHILEAPYLDGGIRIGEGSGCAPLPHRDSIRQWRTVPRIGRCRGCGPPRIQYIPGAGSDSRDRRDPRSRGRRYSGSPCRPVRRASSRRATARSPPEMKPVS